MMRAHQRLAGELVQRARQPFGESAAVDEDERRSVRENQLEQPRMDGGPDRRTGIADRRRPARNVVRRRQLRHVLDRHLDRQLQPFLLAGIDDGDGAITDGALTRGELVLDLRVDLLFVVARAFPASARLSCDRASARLAEAPKARRRQARGGA